MNLKKLFQRYNPRRKHIEVDETTLILLSQLGYAELYRGEWFLNDDGIAALREGIRIAKEQHADLRA